MKFFWNLPLQGKLMVMMGTISVFVLVSAMVLLPLHERYLHDGSLVLRVIVAGGILTAGVLVGVCLSFWARRFVARPIDEIITATTAITEHEPDYSIRVPEHDRSDEIGALVRGFNTMLAHLEESDRKIKAAHIELEQRVETRTRELIDEIKYRRNTEAALRHERDKAQKYLDMAGVMLVALDTEGNVTLLNRKGTEITGYEEEELLGRNWFNTMLLAEESDAIRQVFRDVLSGSVRLSEHHENAIQTKSGEQRLIQWHNTRLISADGDILGVLSSGMDITEQALADEELRRTQKLESIGTFAGGIAHDFNNFLMVIHGNIELAQMSLDNPSKVDQLLDDAAAAAGRARGLTRQLITFSKGGQPQMRTVNLVGTVRESVSFVLTGSNITSDISVPDDLWLAHVDTGQIEQVLTNLVVNAKHAMPDGGTIYVHLANVAPEAAVELGMARQRFIELSIRDEGVGISADVLPRVFDPYFTTKQEGIGLGLATSYSIVMKHGGHLMVDSQIGEGSTFHVYLPALEKESPAERAHAGSAKLTRPYHILLMDDEPMVAEVIKVMLERLKCRASWAKDGQEAVRMYARASHTDDPFDAVILDIIVPAGMGGKEAATKLLEIDPNARLIVSSAYSNDPLMAEHKTHGFRGCLAKPYNHHELEQVLKTVLEPDGAASATTVES